MPEREVKLRRIAHVELRVRDLGESTLFYRDLLGLARVDADPPNERVCVCTTASGAGEGFEVVLTEGLPPGTEVAGLDHVSFEVATRRDVREIYEVARQRQVRATQPRMFDGHYQTYLFDPNGYKIEVIARHGRPGEADAEPG